MDALVAANVLGTLGAVCWSIQLVPQIIVNYRRHNATGLQASMMMLWAWAGVPLGVYNIVEGLNMALRIQPQILTVLSLVTWTQCNYYQKEWSASTSLLALVPIALGMGGTQAALIIGLGILKERGIGWPMTIMAVLSAALLAAGVLRHYWDIWTHRTVRGISFIFVGIDAAGDLFSLLSITFQPDFDILGMVIYGTELALWLGVFACGGYYNLFPWARRRWFAREETGGVVNDGDDGQATETRNGIYLQNMPSSTSVFRTASATTQGIRSRRAGEARESETMDTDP